jgi:hypothetical protein
VPATGGGAALQNAPAMDIDLSLLGLSNTNAFLKIQMRPNVDMQHCLAAVLHLSKVGQRILDGNVFMRVIGHHTMPWLE